MFAAGAQGQGYDFAASSGTFTPLTGATALDAIESDDALSSAIPIGFSFTYFGTAYTSLKVSSNGFIALDPAASGSLNSNGWGSNPKLIAPLWDDLSGSVGTASYRLTGTTGSRILTIEWLNWKWKYDS